MIRQEQCNAEWAIKLQLDNIIEQFDAFTDEYLRERKQDIIQVVERVIKALLGHPNAQLSDGVKKVMIKILSWSRMTSPLPMPFSLKPIFWLYY